MQPVFSILYFSFYPPYHTDTGFEHRAGLERVVRAVYHPYANYTAQYRVFEEVALTQHLDAIRLVSEMGQPISKYLCYENGHTVQISYF